jgi:chromosome segregation ATPase
MQNEYESQIEVLKNDITALENENDQLRQEANDIKEKGNLDIKNCLEDITEIKNEKEEAEQKYMEKLEELNLIIKKYQNKIIEQENAYKALCDTSEKKIKETYDKFTEEIKNIKTSQTQLDNIDGFSASELNLEIHNLKTENFELSKKLETCQLNLSQKQKEFNETNNKLNLLYKYEIENKNKIKKLEEENSNLRVNILNNNSDISEYRDEIRRYALLVSPYFDSSSLKREIIAYINGIKYYTGEISEYTNEKILDVKKKNGIYPFRSI